MKKQKRKILEGFVFEITSDGEIGITKNNFAEINIPIRQARVLANWLNKVLKQRGKRK